jgi:hypothetical protein
MLNHEVFEPKKSYAQLKITKDTLFGMSLSSV